MLEFNKLEGMFILELLSPCKILTSLEKLKPEELARQGIKGIIFDLDNTLLLWHEHEVPPKTVVLLDQLKGSGFKLCILSNGYSQRVKNLARSLRVPCVYGAFKPLRRGFRQALAGLELQPEQVAVVGDQLYTDILGGNRSGCYTVWIPPRSTHEFVGTRLTRLLEGWTVAQLRNKGYIKGE